MRTTLFAAVAALALTSGAPGAFAAPELASHLYAGKTASFPHRACTIQVRRNYIKCDGPPGGGGGNWSVCTPSTEKPKPGQKVIFSGYSVELFRGTNGFKDLVSDHQFADSVPSKLIVLRTPGSNTELAEIRLDQRLAPASFDVYKNGERSWTCEQLKDAGPAAPAVDDGGFLVKH